MPVSSWVSAELSLNALCDHDDDSHLGAMIQTEFCNTARTFLCQTPDCRLFNEQRMCATLKVF